MFKIEKRFLEWVEKHILLFCVIGVTLISMIIRYSFREIISNDALPQYASNNILLLLTFVNIRKI